MSLHNA